MSNEDREFLNTINKYAEDVLGDIDPQKTKVSEQIQALRPILQALAMKHQIPVEDVFIKYMDLASEASVERDNEFKAQMGPDFDFTIKPGE